MSGPPESPRPPADGPCRSPDARRVLLLGATGTIGCATAHALQQRGHEVICPVRQRSAMQQGTPDPHTAGTHAGTAPDLPAITWRPCDVTDPASLARDGLRGERIDAVVSCLASRTGVPADAWAIDHQAQRDALRVAADAGAQRFVLLSALCVQKPRLAFQHAKLAFEAELRASGLGWSIVRPTAFFKSLCGQVARVQAGRPYLLFGDGRGTACKPIADEDLADYLADCLDDADKHERILPIGGPGPAITPREMGERLFALTGRPPRYRSVPPAMLAGIATGLGLAGRLLPPLAAKAELARIGHYYATESMLVLDPATGRYDADATPSTGTRTLFELYARLVAGEAAPERREHAVF